MPPNYYHSIHNLKVMYAVLLLSNRGVDHGALGVLTP